MKKTERLLEKALLAAGAVLKKGMQGPKKITYKSPISLLTETDKNAERVVMDLIKKTFPKHAILSEESKPYGTSGCKWIIDPVDGTTNFAHGFPAACISIAYEEYGVLELGGVWNPFLNEWFWAKRGSGAYLNGRRIRVSKAKSLKQSLLATGFPYDRKKYSAFYLSMMEAVMFHVQGIRRMGSAALDLCYVACGRFDGYWEFKLNPWDQAAGVLIVREAGGNCTDFGGAPINIYGYETVATNGLIHKELIRTLKKPIVGNQKSKNMRSFKPKFLLTS